MTPSDNISAIEAIEKALEKATPGVWDVWEEQTPNKADAIAEMAYQVENSDPFVEVVYLLNADGKCPATTGCGPTSAANAAYISACSPERMRSILAEARKAEAMEREIAELREALAEASDAISAFADSVFNDNGDMTVNLGLATGDDYIRAYFADRRARTLLNGGSDAHD
ncbi:hypothetical protein [Shinella sp. JR1-6]|uniref:hypothetical protein n=1 Tax=Shinella sp. JR1-6 TaxID=2527671 RepID=UPI00102D3A0E|nr:hypothetical protein [Shinella sp. JR1-6]TAA54062.1 hypothetical protein EXZ48_27505 [Shinella sp. JR1-6]